MPGRTTGSATAVLALAAIGLLAAGCGDPRTAHLAPVSGRVERGSQPLAGGSVVFVPEPPLKAAIAYGTIDATGRYTMATINKYPGVAPGSYRVCVIATGEPDDGGKQGSDPALDPLLQRPRSLVAAKYGSDATTPLRFDVRPGGNVFDIRLE